MTLKEDLTNAVTSIALESWDVGAARNVPDLNSLTLGNSGRTLDACFVYADLSDSTGIVQRAGAQLAAEFYKAFLLCASRIIVANEGSIEAYDGDRVMGVFLGTEKEQNAVIAAFQINFAVHNIVNPGFKFQNQPDIQHTLGIDTGSIMACKAGVRGVNELIWIGSPANYAAKLNSFKGLDHAFSTRITQAVKNRLPAHLLQASSGADVWEGPYSNVGVSHFRSSWWMEL